MSKPGFWSELKARGVARAAATYLVTSWLILEVGHLLSLILEMPHMVMRFVLWLLVLGFPIAMVLAWNYRTMAAGGLDVELPETEPASRSEHELHEEHGGHGHGHGATIGAVDPLPFIVGGLVVAALLFLGASRMFGVGSGGGHGSEDAAHAEGAAKVAGPIAPAIAAPAPAPQNSIAVLAFANLSGDAKQEYFSDGLSEELIDALSRVTQLQVAARTSSFAFKGKAIDAATIGQQLRAAWLLDGSVRRDGNAIRVSAQLVDAKTGFRTWSQTYDREVKDIFAVQQDIGNAVADALKVKMLGATPAAVTTGGTTNQAAYESYLRGRQLVDLNGNEAQWRAALAAFDAAVAADPNYASAHAARARTLIGLGAAFLPADRIAANLQDALASARRAVTLAPDLAEAQSTLAFALASGKLDFAAAAEPYEKALQLGSGNADILIRYGVFACRSGKIDAGITALRKAVGLDPLNPRAHKSLAIGLYAARRFDESIISMRRALALSPSMTVAHSVVGDGLLALGRAAEAKIEYSAEPVDWARLTGLAVTAARNGGKVDAQRLLAELRTKRNGVSRYQEAQILAQIGDRRGAIEALQSAYASGDAGIVSMRIDPLLDPVRSEAGFKTVQAKIFG